MRNLLRPQNHHWRPCLRVLQLSTLITMLAVSEATVLHATHKTTNHGNTESLPTAARGHESCTGKPRYYCSNVAMLLGGVITVN
jgi:hypothetical protein